MDPGQSSRPLLRAAEHSQNQRDPGDRYAPDCIFLHDCNSYVLKASHLIN
jgi:hypothetical protein